MAVSFFEEVSIITLSIDGKKFEYLQQKKYVPQYDVKGLNFNLASNSAKKKKDLLDDLFDKEIQEWSEYKDQKSIKKDTFIRQKRKQNDDNNRNKTVIVKLFHSLGSACWE